MNELLTRQAKMAELVAELERTTNPEHVRRLTSELTVLGKELDALAHAFEAEQLRKAGPTPKGYFEVELTPAQQARVREKTGVLLTTVQVPDPSGTLTRAMPHTNPDQIEQLAVDQAERAGLEREVAGKARAEAEALLSAIEAGAGGDLKRHIERLRADPNFLDGLLHQKKDS